MNPGCLNSQKMKIRQKAVRSKAYRIKQEKAETRMLRNLWGAKTAPTKVRGKRVRCRCVVRVGRGEHRFIDHRSCIQHSHLITNVGTSRIWGRKVEPMRRAGMEKPPVKRNRNALVKEG